MADKTSPSIARVTIASALALGILFVGCWIGTRIDLPAPIASHAFVALFTAYPVSSLAALVEGTLVALVTGAIAGFLWASLYKVIPAGRTS